MPICFVPSRSPGWPLLSAVPQYAAEVRHLTLTEAVHLAISQNRALKIARLKVSREPAEESRRAFGLFPVDHQPIECAAYHGLCRV